MPLPMVTNPNTIKPSVWIRLLLESYKRFQRPAFLFLASNNGMLVTDDVTNILEVSNCLLGVIDPAVKDEVEQHVNIERIYQTYLYYRSELPNFQYNPVKA